jgi:DNA-binding Xre family transcriptional regulator
MCDDVGGATTMPATITEILRDRLWQARSLNRLAKDAGLPDYQVRRLRDGGGERMPLAAVDKLCRALGLSLVAKGDPPCPPS